MIYQKRAVEKYINDYLDDALAKASQILGRNPTMSIGSFNGIIGGKNDIYHINPSDYDSPEEYVEAWMASHKRKYEKEKNYSYEKSSHRIEKMLQSASLKKFIENYLARTYFRKN